MISAVPAMIYELRKNTDGYALCGGRLQETLQCPERDGIEYAARMVSFLAQLGGGELRIYDADGALTATKVFGESVRPAVGELGNP